MNCAAVIPFAFVSYSSFSVASCHVSVCFLWNQNCRVVVQLWLENQTEDGNAVRICLFANCRNLKTGQLLKKMHIGYSYPASICHRAYSDSVRMWNMVIGLCMDCTNCGGNLKEWIEIPSLFRITEDTSEESRLTRTNKPHCLIIGFLHCTDKVRAMHQSALQSLGQVSFYVGSSNTAKAQKFYFQCPLILQQV